MGTGTAARPTGKGAPPENRDRCVQRTVDLSEAEIAAVEAAEMTPAERRHIPRKLQGTPEDCHPAISA